MRGVNDKLEVWGGKKESNLTAGDLGADNNGRSAEVETNMQTLYLS